jgi:hypothetical protein
MSYRAFAVNSEAKIKTGREASRSRTLLVRAFVPVEVSKFVPGLTKRLRFRDKRVSRWMVSRFAFVHLALTRRQRRSLTTAASASSASGPGVWTKSE